MSSGLDELERRGRWGRTDPVQQAQPNPPSAPARLAPRATPKTPPKAPRARPTTPKPLPASAPGGVERVVIYLSPEQTAWIRERQIDGLRAGKRITTSKLIRELLDRAMR